MVSTPKAPQAPDPYATATAQTAMNKDTALSQSILNMTNQVTPEGSLSYRQSGEIPYYDSAGNLTALPQFTATTTYSPEQQKIYDIGKQTETNIATIGRDQSARIGDLLGKPVELGNEATEARLMELGSKRLDPRFAREEESLRTRLVNQGLRPGTAAFDAEMSNFSQGRNDAYNSLLLQGRGQAVQEALTERSTPINEISALLSGSQVSQPNFIGTPQTQVAGTDYTGAVNSAYQGALNSYNQQVGSNNAMMGGLFGLAGTIGKAAVPMISDRRLKRDISRVGALPNGLPVYTFRYLWSDDLHTGLMSDDVRKVHPDAVLTMSNGFDAVDYAKAVL